MTDEERIELLHAAQASHEAREYRRTVTDNPWIPHKPFPKQQEFLLHIDTLEVFFGGAAGGGKSIAALMAAAQYVDVPGYSALLLRQSFRDLNQPEALIPVSKKWWGGKAEWSELHKRWTFPSGATVSFGYLENDRDVEQYDGAAYAFIGYDEVQQFSEYPYRYLFSRVRKPKSLNVPLRVRATGMPGSRGHNWVKKRFITSPDAGRVFVPSRLPDNYALDKEAYVASLSNLDPVTRRQRLEGDWDAYSGGRFDPAWFRPFRVRYAGTPQQEYVLPDGRAVSSAACWRLTVVDPACTGEEQGTDQRPGDYTAILTAAVTPEREVLVLDVVREHLKVEDIPPRVAEVCDRWKPLWVGVESVAFQQGVYAALRREPGVPAVKPLFPAGKDKLTRAMPAVIRAEGGQIYVPDFAPFREEFLGELAVFTGIKGEDAHDDMVDALSYAISQIDEYSGIVHGQLVPNPGRRQEVPNTGPPQEGDGTYVGWREVEKQKAKVMPWERPALGERVRPRLYGME